MGEKRKGVLFWARDKQQQKKVKEGHSQGRVGDKSTVELLQKEEENCGSEWKVQTHSNVQEHNT